MVVVPPPSSTTVSTSCWWRYQWLWLLCPVWEFIYLSIHLFSSTFFYFFFKFSVFVFSRFTLEFAMKNESGYSTCWNGPTTLAVDGCGPNDWHISFFFCVQVIYEYIFIINISSSRNFYDTIKMGIRGKYKKKRPKKTTTTLLNNFNNVHIKMKERVHISFLLKLCEILLAGVYFRLNGVGTITGNEEFLLYEFFFFLFFEITSVPRS